jgi:hypothetical protein
MLCDQSVRAMLTADDPYVSHACFVSTLNYYYRTFEDKHDRQTDTGWSLGGRKIHDFDQDLHKWLIALRNRVIAHHEPDEHADRVVFPRGELQNMDNPRETATFYLPPIPMVAMTFGVRDRELAQRIADHAQRVLGHIKQLCADSLLTLAKEVLGREASDIQRVLKTHGAGSVFLQEERFKTVGDSTVTIVIDPTPAEPGASQTASLIDGLSTLKIRVDIRDGNLIQFMNKIE